MKGFINKFTLMLTLFILMITSVNAVSTLDSYNNIDLIEQEYSDKDYLKVHSFIYLAFTNSTLDLDTGVNYHPESEVLLEYVISNNNIYEQEFVFVTIYKDENDDTFAKGNFINISPSGSEYVIVEPERDFEYISTEVYCNDPLSETCGAGYQVKKILQVEKKTGLNSAFAPLIAGTGELINIFIGFWQAFYYIFISVILLIIVIGIFWGTFRIMEKTKSLNQKEGFHGFKRGD